MKEYISKSLEDTAKIASDFASSLSDRIKDKAKYENRATIIGLYGDLGSGKTTFMKYFASALGIKETIQSPTFIIMKIFNLEFSIFKKLIHIDAYRLEKSEELLKLGWDEIIKDPQNLICIEWPERVEEIIPESIKIEFQHVENENERKIIIDSKIMQ